MKKIKSFFRNYSFFLAPFGSIASIVGLILIIVNSEKNGLYALIFFLIFLGITLTQILLKLNKMAANKYPDGDRKLATSYRYTTNDAKYINYEIYKLIQCKRAVSKSHEHQFHWTGTKTPKISSQLQKISSKIIKSPKDYDKIELTFKEPILYNDVALVHLFMELDDSDQESKPHLESKVNFPTLQIHFKVELTYKPDNYNERAIIYKKEFGTVANREYEKFDTAIFDIKSKSYDYYLLNPEPGYFYKIEWQR